MYIGLAFWILMLLAFVFGIGRSRGMIDARFDVGADLLLFLLLFLFGWGVFGFAIHS